MQDRRQITQITFDIGFQIDFNASERFLFE